MGTQGCGKGPAGTWQQWPVETRGPLVPMRVLPPPVQPLSQSASGGRLAPPGCQCPVIPQQASPPPQGPGPLLVPQSHLPCAALPVLTRGTLLGLSGATWEVPSSVRGSRLLGAARSQTDTPPGTHPALVVPTGAHERGDAQHPPNPKAHIPECRQDPRGRQGCHHVLCREYWEHAGVSRASLSRDPVRGRAAVGVALAWGVWPSLAHPTTED